MFMVVLRKRGSFLGSLSYGVAARGFSAKFEPYRGFRFRF